MSATAGTSLRPAKHGLRRVLLAVAAAAGSLCQPLAAQQDEHAVRAAFVFNLTRYVTWPQFRPDLTVCYAGDAGAGAILKYVLDGKVSDSRTIHLVLQPSEASLSTCDVLYVSDSAVPQQSMLARISARPTLTVGESEKFVRAGGMVGLVRVGDQIQIEVNLETLRAAGLAMSSRLLNLAFIVHTTRRE